MGLKKKKEKTGSTSHSGEWRWPCGPGREIEGSMIGPSGSLAQRSPWGGAFGSEGPTDVGFDGILEGRGPADR